MTQKSEEKWRHIDLNEMLLWSGKNALPINFTFHVDFVYTQAYSAIFSTKNKSAMINNSNPLQLLMHKAPLANECHTKWLRIYLFTSTKFILQPMILLYSYLLVSIFKITFHTDDKIKFFYYPKWIYKMLCTKNWNIHDLSWWRKWNSIDCSNG